MRNATTPNQKLECIASESFILDGIFQSQALGRLCDVGEKGRLQQEESLGRL